MDRDSSAPDAPGATPALSPKAARKVAKAQGKAAATAVKQQRKTSAANSKHRRSESKAERKAAKAATKASKAASKASEAAAEAAATRPARVIDKVTDPKTAKRAVALGKILAPAMAPFVLKAATNARAGLDEWRARRLGVPAERVAEFRGPTGRAGARISGLTDALRDLASRRGSDLQVTRFVDVASTRLGDLTATVQASASMPRARRTEVLRAVDRELDDIDADVVSHLMAER